MGTDSDIESALDYHWSSIDQLEEVSSHDCAS